MAAAPAVRLETLRGDSQVARPPEQLGWVLALKVLISGSLISHPESSLLVERAFVVFPRMRASDEVLTLTF